MPERLARVVSLFELSMALKVVSALNELGRPH